MLPSTLLRLNILLVTAMASAANRALALPLSLGVGQQEALTFESLAHTVNVDRSGIVDITKGETKSVIVLTGKSEGAAVVTIRLEDGKTVVYSVNVSRATRNTFTSLMNKLRKAPGISVEPQGSRYMVSGQFRNRSDQLVMQNALRDFPGLIMDTTDPDVVESNAVVRTINRVLAENDIANLQAHAYGQIIALEGSPKNDIQKSLALRIARTISPGIEDHVSTDSNVSPPVAIEVLFIEASKSNKKAYGLEGPQSAFEGKDADGHGMFKASTTGFNANRVLGTRNLTWQIGSLSAFLKLQHSKSSSRVVSNPKLITRSGQKALFESGGAFFIPQEEKGPDGLSVKTYVQQTTGITLSIEPRIDAIGQIDSKIKTTIIEIAEKSETDAPPSLLKSNLETAVTVPNGQSILLSGLTLKKARKSVSRVPLLADIPIIGELFKERAQEFEEREVAVIVTMKRVAPTENRAQVADQLFETSDNDVSFSFFD
ncbi:MAG: type II and III secretion system protein, partial [Proteobacteria bacterium]|nr:type II and III secretion system protein [Pseudomonadota bacterium]